MMESRAADTGGMIKEGADTLGLNLGQDAIDALDRYVEELHRWSRKINLVGKKQSLSQLVENHFLDSLLLLPSLKKAESLVDIGTGAGFPGLVCKTALQGLHLHLVEPRLKRVSFLRHMIRLLQLTDVEVHAVRAEQLVGENLCPSHITSRAVAEIGDLLTLADGIAVEGTTLLFMKGPKWQQELDSAAGSACCYIFSVRPC